MLRHSKVIFVYLRFSELWVLRLNLHVCSSFSLVDVSRRFGGPYCFHLQGRKESHAKNQVKGGKQSRLTCHLYLAWLPLRSWWWERCISPWSVLGSIGFSPRERAVGTHWLRALSSPRIDVDAVEKKNFLPLSGILGTLILRMATVMFVETENLHSAWRIPESLTNNEIPVVKFWGEEWRGMKGNEGEWRG